MRYSTSGYVALRSILRPTPLSAQDLLPNKTFLVKRCITTSTTQLAKMPGSLFGWNPFTKKKTEQTEGFDAELNNGQKKESDSASVIDVESKIVESTRSKKEPLEDKVAEWVPVDGTLDHDLVEPERNIILNKEQISQIFYKTIRDNHPDATENSSDEELLSLSISDPCIKLKVLPPLEEALNTASKSKLYNFPNRNLNNSITIRDVHTYYLVQEEMTGALNRFPLEKFFRDLKDKAATDPTEVLPPNLSFKPYVRKSKKPKEGSPSELHVPKKVKTSMPKKKGGKGGPPKHLRNHLKD